jgi:hypothetical protein
LTPAFAGPNPAVPARKKHFFGSAFFNESHLEGAIRFMRAQRVIHGTAGFRLMFADGKCFIKWTVNHNYSQNQQK